MSEKSSRDYELAVEFVDRVRTSFRELDLDKNGKLEFSELQTQGEPANLSSGKGWVDFAARRFVGEYLDLIGHKEKLSFEKEGENFKRTLSADTKGAAVTTSAVTMEELDRWREQIVRAGHLSNEKSRAQTTGSDLLAVVLENFRKIDLNGDGKLRLKELQWHIQHSGSVGRSTPSELLSNSAVRFALANLQIEGQQRVLNHQEKVSDAHWEVGYRSVRRVPAQYKTVYEVDSFLESADLQRWQKKLSTK